jgi:hypothetical protein
MLPNIAASDVWTRDVLNLGVRPDKLVSLVSSASSSSSSSSSSSGVRETG